MSPQLRVAVAGVCHRELGAPYVTTSPLTNLVASAASHPRFVDIVPSTLRSAANWTQREFCRSSELWVWCEAESVAVEDEETLQVAVSRSLAMKCRYCNYSVFRFVGRLI
jgi:hypothetical protein